MFTQAMGQATSVSEESKRAAIEQLNEEGNVLFGSRKFSAGMLQFLILYTGPILMTKYTSPEYFRVGNDVAEPFSVEILKDFPLDKGGMVSLFFAGGGDARYLYATIIDLHESGKRIMPPLPPRE
ncbi:uncharacterized protein Bfra_005676 [Botrytis fragariae]|uniref:Uncharacterized protein n=1 Tax=Botrytis fragariae TaxID=1964551 RepID=A0A8H6ARJ8_9HELO|nr:uncharacterized protein Bfra_005676 [Botrytis fragariae]KAF5872319.1 hypothetical protein Bfra_005676 [Botrytis fragariae]